MAELKLGTTIGGNVSYHAGNLDADPLGYWSMNGSDLYPTSTGTYVGIGNTNPTVALDVTGAVKVSSTSTFTGLTTHTGGATMSKLLTLNRESGKSSIKSGTADKYMMIDSNGQLLGLNWYVTDNVIIANGGGNVSIGNNTNPTYKLDVSGTARITSLGNWATGDGIVTELNGVLRKASAADIVGDSGFLGDYVAKAGDTMTGVLNMSMFSTINNNTVTFYRGRGTSAAPGSLLSGDTVGDIKFDGYIGGSAHLGYLRVKYFENLVGTTKGSSITLATQNGSYASGWDTFDVFTGFEDGSVLVGQSPDPNFRPMNGFNTIDNNTPIWLANDTQVYGDLFVKDGVHAGDGYCFTMNNVSNTGFNYVSTNLLDLELAGSKKFRFTLGTGQFEADGDVIAYSSTVSDRRLKANIRTLKYGLKEIAQLDPIKFTRKDTEDPRTHLGLIAQEVEKIIPEIVSDYEDHLVLNYTELVPVLINAIKELQARVEQLEKK